MTQIETEKWDFSCFLKMRVFWPFADVKSGEIAKTKPSHACGMANLALHSLVPFLSLIDCFPLSCSLLVLLSDVWRSLLACISWWSLDLLWLLVREKGEDEKKKKKPLYRPSKRKKKKRRKTTRANPRGRRVRRRKKEEKERKIGICNFTTSWC